MWGENVVSPRPSVQVDTCCLTVALGHAFSIGFSKEVVKASSSKVSRRLQFRSGLSNTDFPCGVLAHLGMCCALSHHCLSLRWALPVLCGRQGTARGTQRKGVFLVLLSLLQKTTLSLLGKRLLQSITCAEKGSPLWWEAHRQVHIPGRSSLRWHAEKPHHQMKGEKSQLLQISQVEENTFCQQLL